MTRQGAPGELVAELGRLGVQGLDAMVLKASSTTTIRLAPEAILLPRPFFEAFVARQGLDRELLATGLKAAAEILQPYGPSISLAETYLSYLRCTRGDTSPEEAIDLVVQAAMMLRAVGAEHRVGRAYLELAVTLKAAGVDYDALAALDHAVQRGHQFNDPALLLAAHYERGTICRRIGLPISALEAFATAREFVAPSDVAPEWTERLYAEEAACDLTLGRNAEAEAILASWIESGASTHRPYLMRGDLRAQSGDRSASLEDYIEGCLLAGRTIRGAASDRFRRSDARQAQEIFQAGIVAAVAADASATAFGLSELFLAGPAAFQPDSVAGAAPASPSMPETRLDPLILKAQEATDRGDEQDLAAIQNEAEWLLGHADVLRSRRAEAPISRSVLLKWCERVQGSLPPDTALLEYAEAGGQMVVFCLTPSKIYAHQTEVSALEIGLLATAAQHEILGRFPTDALAQLGRHLLDPLTETLHQVRALRIITSQVLAGVSFAAMPLNGQPLIATHSVGYALSAQRISGSPRATVTHEQRWQGIGCPHPRYALAQPLAFVEPELRQVAQQFAAPNLKLGDAATADALLSALRESDILHLACHGVFVPEAPLLSHLLLADRPVFAFELLHARHAPPLVVLSACETARARPELGGHVQSLSAAFLASGAEAVLGAFWQLDDQAAAAIMDGMYQASMPSPGQSIQEALALAQRKIRHQDPHPYAWASLGVFSGGNRS
ncbi:MAG: CHAT domain-containing protein [Phenylobacterium sp.]|uniref:CHAT domain-containing protein n=1 Tax=Phenylobacterium sp. TaxID=1871053 RepID=UPI00122A0E54|nr:CHAT domain-containing protein [Phenylobacterium sp.]TAL34962.1 MAG: CHAT domain-containing protein [Phenylobacterium sp.]